MVDFRRKIEVYLQDTSYKMQVITEEPQETINCITAPLFLSGSTWKEVQWLNIKQGSQPISTLTISREVMEISKSSSTYFKDFMLQPLMPFKHNRLF